MHVASFRMRCHMVMHGLRAQGVNVVLYEPGDQPEVLVLSKLYEPSSLAHALDLRRRFGTRLYLDLCDNHFYSKDQTEETQLRAAQLDVAICSVDHVITSTSYLAEIIRARPRMQKPVSVIDDLIEFPHPAKFFEPLCHPRRFAAYAGLRVWLDATTPDVRQRLVWFGNHGSGFADSGMNDLETIRPVLEAVRGEAPISLTVISNSREKYEHLIRDWSLPTRYLEWNETYISPALRLHCVSVIPIRANPFTLAKSANRVETSLVHGLGVVADRIPSYDKYADNVYLDHWAAGLRALTTGTGLRQLPHAEKFQLANEVIVASWLDLLFRPA